MKKVYFYEYCKGILGVKTDVEGFKWVYGSVAPAVPAERYESCAVKFEIYLKPEREFNSSCQYDGKFQSYFWDTQTQTLACRRTLFGRIQIGYNIVVKENVVVAEIGQNYYRLVKGRMMNLHGTYYLLSDLANLILLKNGYLTLYASGVQYEPLGRGVVCFAAPSTGKTVTAMGLCRRSGYRLIGEDIMIVQGQQLFACPWTSSYRGKKSLLDSTGAIRRAGKQSVANLCNTCQLTHLVTLAAGDNCVDSDKAEILRQITILNGYLFQYYSSPIIKILEYFQPAYSKGWNSIATELLMRLVDSGECHMLHSDDAMEFSEILHGIIAGGK